MNKKLLLKFCGTDDERMKLPFSVGDHTYATDGSILIKALRMPEFPDNPLAPDPEKLEYEKNPKKWYPIKGIKVPKKVDCRTCEGQGRNFVCPECEGGGTVWLSNSYSEYPDIDCKSCGGSGKVAFCEECDGTGKVTPPRNPINFNGVFFDQNYLALLSELPNCEIGPISKTATTPFRFDGGSGVVMPMLQ